MSLQLPLLNVPVSEDIINLQNVRNHHETFTIQEKTVNAAKLIEVLGGANAILIMRIFYLKLN